MLSDYVLIFHFFGGINSNVHLQTDQASRVANTTTPIFPEASARVCSEKGLNFFTCTEYHYKFGVMTIVYKLKTTIVTTIWFSRTENDNSIDTHMSTLDPSPKFAFAVTVLKVWNARFAITTKILIVAKICFCWAGSRFSASKCPAATNFDSNESLLQ